MKQLSKTLFTLLLLAVPSFLSAGELTEIEPDAVNSYGTKLVELFKKSVEETQVKIEADLESAVGLHNEEEKEGIILIPTALAEDPQGNEEVNSEKGAGLAYLFLSEKYEPVIDGKPIAKEKLRFVEFTTDSGETKKAMVLVLAAKHTEDDEWFMYVYGSGDEPLIKTQFGLSDEAREEPIALNVFVEEGEDEATLAVTVKEQFEATFQIKNQAKK